MSLKLQCTFPKIFLQFLKISQKITRDFYRNKVRVAIMTHDHNDTPHAILTLLLVPAGK